MTDKDWDKLLGLVKEKLLVPVTGPELLVSDDLQGGDLYYRIWGKALAAESSIPGGAEPQDRSLFDVANQLSTTCTANDLAYDINAVLRRPWPVPTALKQLAEMTSFELYVTTTIDHLLENALRDPAAGRKRIEDVVFYPNGPKTHIDLPCDLPSSLVPCLFHLFGSSSPADGTFAKTEDDLIEFSWSLLEKNGSPQKLYDFLKHKTILMLGCNFPDWLARFFIRALHGGNSGDRPLTLYYVSENCEPGLREYLCRRKAKVFTDMSPADFVAELHRRWEMRPPEESTAPRIGAIGEENPRLKPGAVFLSYAKDDIATAMSVRRQLEKANIDTWMDVSSLEPGQDFAEIIKDNISNASCFVAIVSRKLAEDPPGGRFLWREWNWAREVKTRRKPTDTFLVPLAVDATPEDANFVDETFRQAHWARLEDGAVPQDLVRVLTEAIRKYRRGAGQSAAAGDRNE